MPNHRDSKDATGRLTAKGVVGQPSVAIKFNDPIQPARASDFLLINNPARGLGCNRWFVRSLFFFKLTATGGGQSGFHRPRFRSHRAYHF